MVQDFCGLERSTKVVWWALEEGLDGPLFLNGLERGQAHHWAVERVCMIHQLGGWGG